MPVKIIKKKTVYLNVGLRRYRYIEILQEILPVTIDLTISPAASPSSTNPADVPYSPSQDPYTYPPSPPFNNQLQNPDSN